MIAGDKANYGNMIPIAGRLVLETLVLLLLASFIVFGLFSLIPGDFLTELELTPGVGREEVEEMRRQFGLDRSLPSQYVYWLSQTVRGNWGQSFAQQRPAFDLVSERLAGTVLLAATALAMVLLVAFPLGIVTALDAGGRLDRLGLVLSAVGLALPPVLSSLLLLYVAYALGGVPATTGAGILLPAATLALPAAAFLARSLRLEMVEVMRGPFIRAAVARGLPPSRVLLHAVRNAVNPLISMAGLVAGGLLSGSVLVERVFSYPGLGSLMVDSILARDLFVAVACVLVATLAVILTNLLAELLLAWNDPRIRLP